MDVPTGVMNAGLGAILSFGAAAVAFRVALERRLARLERDAEQFPPKHAHDRIGALENDVKSLRPLQDLLHEHGEGAARFAFQGGRQP